MANAYRALGQDDDALAGYDHYLRVDPKNAWVHYQAGEIHLDRGALERASEYFQQALAIVLAESQGDADGALAAYRREFEQHDDACKAVFNAARLLQQRRSPEARALFERAVAINERFAEGHFYLAQARLAAGETDGAVASARAGLEIDRTSSSAPLGHFVLADVAMRQGRLEEAARELEAGTALEQRTRLRR